MVVQVPTANRDNQDPLEVPDLRVLWVLPVPQDHKAGQVLMEVQGPKDHLVHKVQVAHLVQMANQAEQGLQDLKGPLVHRAVLVLQDKVVPQVPQVRQVLEVLMEWMVQLVLWDLRVLQVFRVSLVLQDRRAQQVLLEILVLLVLLAIKDLMA